MEIPKLSEQRDPVGVQEWPKKVRARIVERGGESAYALGMLLGVGRCGWINRRIDHEDEEMLFARDSHAVHDRGIAVGVLVRNGETVLALDVEVDLSIR